ncbi:uncharacterized protein LOC113324096 [Papaver somniferum]|uniref:uncharacterized protein LOC113324096 n=1 Tax=Papaver somniferum TaxID=3469 RepID=UPI000E6F96AA|nr:uncharacterized protein LOC113324096 [Papaver somniferum]
MGSDFEPSDDLTGGAWYDKEGKLETELIEEAKSVCFQFTSRRKAATVEEITEAINNSEAFKVKFTGKQIEELVQGLILDKKIVESESTGKGVLAKNPMGEQLVGLN